MYFWIRFAFFEYQKQVVSIRQGAELDRNQLIRDLVSIQFERNDIDFQRGRFRVRGDVVEIFRLQEMNVPYVWSFWR